MPEFLHLSSPSEALQTLLQTIKDQEVEFEFIDTNESLDRVLAFEVHASHALPEFHRSAMDGYAVRAHDTFGASDSQPGYLDLIGEVPMGDVSKIVLKPGTCTSIHTGGILPGGADAVIMLEYTQLIPHRKPRTQDDIKDNHRDVDEKERKSFQKNGHSVEEIEVEISRAVAVGENVVQAGEDVGKGQMIMSAGTRICPAHIGGCMALGITELRVAVMPTIGILSSGDEIISPAIKPRPGQVRDINSYSLEAIIKRAGGKPILYGIVPDNLEILTTIAAKAIDECAAVVITAGSSASARDITSKAIGKLGMPGVLVHGINIRPGKPTILAVCNGKAVIGLPGNPVSAFVIAGLFVVPVIEKLIKQKVNRPRPSIMARLSVNIPSQAGREDWIAVRLLENKGEFRNEGIRYLAEPIFGKSNLIFSLVAADGLVCIPTDMTGMSAGEFVEVVLI